MHRVGFEPTPPKREDLKSPALDQLGHRCKRCVILLTHTIVWYLFLNTFQHLRGANLFFLLILNKSV